MIVNGKYRSHLAAASQVLARQQANVVLCRPKISGGQPVFRRGSIPLDIPPQVARVLADSLGATQEILFALRNHSDETIRRALEHHIVSGDIEKDFADLGIRCYKAFPKLLLVPPYGTADGNLIKNVVPHKGVERIAWYILRNTENGDARVYNPNLGTPEGLIDLVKEEYFDIIGFSYLGSTLEQDIPIMAKVSLASPGSIFVMGGTEVKKLPHAEIFSALPLDLMVIGSGEKSLAEIMARILPGFRLPDKALLRFRDIPNLVIYERGGVYYTPRNGINGNGSIDFTRYLEDVPFDRPDVTHGLSYGRRQAEIFGAQIIPYDHIGRNSFHAKISDRCLGICIFCSAPKDQIEPIPVEEVISYIKQHKHEIDSIHFDDNDLLFDRRMVIQLCKGIIREGLDKIPKLCKARVDGADREVFSWLVKAGFKIIAYGIETFDQRGLDYVHKRIKVEQIDAAIEMAIEFGIRPGLNLIFFLPTDTIETLAHTVERSLHYAARGAYLNVSQGLGVNYGDYLDRLRPSEVGFTTLYVEGLRGGMRIPSYAKVWDKETLEFRGRVLAERDRLISDLQGKTRAYISVAVIALCFCKAVYLILNRPTEEIAGIDRLIDLTMRRELDNSRVRVLPKEAMDRTERMLVMLKPDLVGRGSVKDLMLSLASKLDAKGIKFRIAAPKIVRMTEPTTRVFYKGDADYFLRPDGTGLLPYIVGTHPEAKVPKAPVVFFVLEGEKGLIEAARTEEVLGPTNPLDDASKKSLRYLFSIGLGAEARIGGDLMNVMHMSGNPRETSKQIGVVYSPDELRRYWPEEGVSCICALQKEHELRPKIVGEKGVTEWSFDEVVLLDSSDAANLLEAQLRADDLVVERRILQRLVEDIMEIRQEIEKRENDFLGFVKDKGAS